MSTIDYDEIEKDIKKYQSTADKTLKPTQKWIAGLVGGVALVLLHTVASGGFDSTEIGELAALASVLVPAYLKRNDPTPGGVPVE